MFRKTHSLISDTPGTQRVVHSHHYGVAGCGPILYIQAGLHAGEIPGMLVARHLMPMLEEAEAAGRMRGEITVVPVANPIGLAQGLMHESLGRFEFHSMENFNRHYPDLAALIGDGLEAHLGDDAEANTRAIRRAMAEALSAQPQKTELESLRTTLLGMACQADMVLDMHCDLEAVCHLYTTENSRDWGAELSRHIDARVVLLAEISGGNAFDEACSTPWDALRKRYGARFPIPAGCQAATIEWRGLADVNDTLAACDARHVFDWLIAVGAVAPEAAVPPATKGSPCGTPTFATGDLVPLAGTDDIEAPFGGVLSFRLPVGTRVVPGDVVVDLIDPESGERAELKASVSGLLFAHEHRRFVRRGTLVAQVAGAVPIRSGNLLVAK